LYYHYTIGQSIQKEAPFEMECKYSGIYYKVQMKIHFCYSIEYGVVRIEY
jgi:hypothetical protein